jgi:AraC-like DNA-binding protein
MKMGAQPLLVLHPDVGFRAKIRAIAGKHHTYHELSDWMQLGEAVRSSPPSALAIVDPYLEAEEPGPSKHLRDLMLEYPSVPVFAALPVRPDRIEDLRTLGKWGVTQIIGVGHDDTGPAMLQRFRAAQGRPLKALLEQVLPRDTPGRARAIMDAAAEVVAMGGSVDHLAKNLHMSRRTLLRWSERAELPPPRKLLAWFRILLAAELLDDPGRTALSVAQGCGYSSDSGLRRVTQKFVGKSPTEMRRSGAFAGASKGFLEALQHHRKEPV